MTAYELKKLIADTTINDDTIFEVMSRYINEDLPKLENKVPLTDTETQDMEDVIILLFEMRPIVQAKLAVLIKENFGI